MTSSISRRSFLKGSVATATAASLAACGGSDGGDSADGSKKKIVRWGQGNPKLGLDMQKSTNSSSSIVSDPVFESLLRWTEETGERRTGKEAAGGGTPNYVNHPIKRKSGYRLKR